MKKWLIRIFSPCKIHPCHVTDYWFQGDTILTFTECERCGRKFGKEGFKVAP